MRPCGCGHGQDPGHHPPHRVGHRLGRVHPAEDACPDLHGACRERDAAAAAGPRCPGGAGPHLPLGGAAAAAVLLAPGRGRPAARAREPQGPADHRGRAGHASEHGPGHHPGRRRGDRVGQGVHAHPGHLRPRGREPGHARGLRRPHHAAAVPVLRGPQGGPAPHRLRGRAAHHRGDPRGGREDRGGRARPVPTVRGGRVPGRLTPAAAPAGRVAGVPGRPLRGGGRLPDHLLLHGCHLPPPAGVPGPLPGGLGGGADP